MVSGLELQDVRITKGGAPLVSLDCRVAPGEVLSIMGPSGIGKSTLLAFVTGTLPDAFQATGRVFVAGRGVLSSRCRSSRTDPNIGLFACKGAFVARLDGHPRP